MTDDQPRAEDMEFLDALDALKPDNLSGEAIILACRDLIVGYAPDMMTAGIWLRMLSDDLKATYLGKMAEQADGECMCPNCTAARKATAN